MARAKPEPRTAMHRTYLLDDWEGGVAVYGMVGEYGTRIIAIPRLQLSTCLMGHRDYDSLQAMLRLNRTLRSEPKQLDLLADMILTDFRNIVSTESA